ncbi:dihydroxyacetone kinase [Clostridia bacterium]|nr:dihydroxyacetone kinase [Clostridia bacterium]
MKKIINKTDDIVRDMLEGIAFAYPDIELLPNYKVVKKAVLDPDKVSLIGGGGSGHEPAHAGFIGRGMLDAAVCGDVFASPSQVQIYNAIRAVSGNKGVLLIIKNYSGDMMNFKNAAYLAQEDGIEVEYVRVDDDIAVEDSLYTVGRRGVAGTIFVHKIAGAAAEQGKPLAEVKRIAEKVVTNVRSLGFALTSCTVPTKGAPTFELGETEIEYGVGIHGEPGTQREQLQTANILAKRMIDSLDKELNLSADQARVAVLVNGFGATPLMELYLLNKYVTQELLDKNIVIAREFVGNYMTSIDMAGASVTILKLDEETETLLNEPAETPGFHVAGKTAETKSIVFDYGIPERGNQSFEMETPDECAVISDNKASLLNIQYLVDAMSVCIIRNEQHFCELDSFAGDGDFGMSVAKGFRQLKREWPVIIKEHSQDIGEFLGACSLVIMEYCGGASGPIWGSAFRAAGRAALGKQQLSVKEFASILQSAVNGIQTTGERAFGRGAVVGDKTLIDALVPTAEVWNKADDSDGFARTFTLGAEAAVAGAKSTENFVAHMGRAGTVGERSIGHPDAGAYALGEIFTELAQLIGSVLKFSTVC